MKVPNKSFEQKFSIITCTILMQKQRENGQVTTIRIMNIILNVKVDHFIYSNADQFGENAGFYRSILQDMIK
jgi:hypothetical protein